MQTPTLQPPARHFAAEDAWLFDPQLAERALAGTLTFASIEATSDAPTFERAAGESVPAEAVSSEWSEQYDAMLRESLALFMTDVLGMEIAPHILEWSRMQASHDRVAILAARDHGKSAWASYALPIWLAWKYPGEEVYVFSKTIDAVVEFIEMIVHGRGTLAGIDNTPAIAHLLKRNGAGKVIGNKTDIRLTNGSRIRGVSWGKMVRGRHPRFVVLDDVIGDESAWSPTQRRKAIEYFKKAIVNVVPRNGQIIVVGTPQSPDDLYADLKKNPRYLYKRFPGIVIAADGKEHALFPWKWTLEELKRKKVELGTLAFDQEIMCVPLSDETTVFPRHLFKPLLDRESVLRPTKAQIRAKKLQVFGGVDIARSANVGADYFVICVVGIDPYGFVHIIDFRRHKGLAFHDQLGEIERTYKRYGLQLVFIESNQMQQVWTDEMKRTTDVPVFPFETRADNKRALDVGVPGIRVTLEQKRIVIPWGDKFSRATCRTWIDEMTYFAYNRDSKRLESIAEHDDMVMAFWIALKAAERGGFSFSNDEGGPEEFEKPMDEAEYNRDMLGVGDEAEDDGEHPFDDEDPRKFFGDLDDTL